MERRQISGIRQGCALTIPFVCLVTVIFNDISAKANDEIVGDNVGDTVGDIVGALVGDRDGDLEGELDGIFLDARNCFRKKL